MTRRLDHIEVIGIAALAASIFFVIYTQFV